MEEVIMQRLKIVLISILILTACNNAPSQGAIETAIFQIQVADQKSVDQNTSGEISQQTTNTPPPTRTKLPTNTPAPTNTPIPPTPIPDPIVLTGTGDSIVDVDNYFEFAIAHIVGNSSGRHFAVTNYGGDGESIDLLVNTTDPYDGIKPLDFRNGEHTTRFEIKANGEWTIEILPVSYARILTVPGSIEGSGDEVFFLDGSKPDLVKITGNDEGRHFAVFSYGSSSDLLVNTTDIYSGTVIVDGDTIAIEVKANGPWTIEISAK